jgi:hypothetical protein
MDITAGNREILRSVGSSGQRSPIAMTFKLSTVMKGGKINGIE